MKEVTEAVGDGAMDEETHQQALDLTKELVAEFQEATQIAGFFQREDEIRSARLKIRRAILDQPFGTRDLVQAVTDRYGPRQGQVQMTAIPEEVLGLKVEVVRSPRRTAAPHRWV